VRWLPDDHLGDAFDAVVGLGIDGAVVELLPVDETDDVGVLLDRSRLAKIGELWSPVLTAALFGRARELRDWRRRGQSSSFASALSEREM